MDHDQRLKLLLQAFLLEFIRLIRAGWVDRFDFTKIEWLPQEVFPDPPQGERRIIDLVARLPVKDSLPGIQHGGPQQGLTLILVEVESRDRATVLRKQIFEYRNFLQAKYNLPVLPLALYLHVGLEGIGWDVYEEWYWEERIEYFRFAYVGLPALDAFTYVQSDNLLAVALSVLMRVADGRRAELKAEAMQRAATSENDEYRRYLLCECIEAYLPLEGPHLAEYEQLLLTPKYQEARMVGQTSYEKGLKKGEEDGLHKGRLRLLGVLRKQLEHRFGTLDQAVLDRLEALSDEELDTLAERIVTSSSLHDTGLAG
jgi:hypothetical protein